jgi:hypothetical protein
MRACQWFQIPYFYKEYQIGQPPQTAAIESSSMDSPEPNDAGAQDTVIACPDCFEPTDRLKIYQVPNIFFAVVVWGWATERLVACPSCMRMKLLEKLFIGILMANIFYPILAFILLSALWMTRADGHSDPAGAEEFRMTRAECEKLASDRPKERKLNSRQDLYVFIGLLVSGVVLGVVMYFLATRPGA